MELSRSQKFKYWSAIPFTVFFSLQFFFKSADEQLQQEVTALDWGLLVLWGISFFAGVILFARGANIEQTQKHTLN